MAKVQEAMPWVALAEARLCGDWLDIEQPVNWSDGPINLPTTSEFAQKLRSQETKSHFEQSEILEEDQESTKITDVYLSTQYPTISKGFEAKFTWEDGQGREAIFQVW